jgi:hypothetical protein
MNPSGQSRNAAGQSGAIKPGKIMPYKAVE